MRIYCTLFDKKYLIQGIALFNSLSRFGKSFKLYVLSMDHVTYQILLNLNISCIVPISLDEVLNSDLTHMRELTTHGQFCWVCQPILCQHILKDKNVEMVTYLEADSIFFSDPEILFSELSSQSVSVVPHNYTPKFDQTNKSGKFCVQFNVFRNDPCAHKVLEYWKLNCFRYRKSEPDKFPAQKSMDDWPKLFDCVKILQNPGAGVAPWNIQHLQFNIVDLTPYVNNTPLVFYHFHQFGFFKNGDYYLGDYPLPKVVINSLYKFYAKELRRAEEMVREIAPDFFWRKEYRNPIGLAELVNSFSLRLVRSYLSQIKKKLTGRYNGFPSDHFI